MSNQREAMKLIQEHKTLTQPQKDVITKKLMKFGIFVAMGRTPNSNSVVDFVGVTNGYIEEELS